MIDLDLMGIIILFVVAALLMALPIILAIDINDVI